MQSTINMIFLWTTLLFIIVIAISFFAGWTSCRRYNLDKEPLLRLPSFVKPEHVQSRPKAKKVINGED